MPNRNHSLPALLLAHVLHGLGLAVHPIVASLSRFSDLYGDTFNSSKLAADSWPGRGTRVYGIVVGFFDPWSIAVSRKVLVDLRRIVRFVIRAHFGHLCFAESMTRS